MTIEEFNFNWKTNYPKTIPLSYRFKKDYKDRWFRIHSLPESKRYANNDLEWKILLTRQNQIITDLIGENLQILLLTGDYIWGSSENIHVTKEEILKSYSFTRLENIDLYKISPQEYDNDQVLRPAYAEIIWKSYNHDNLLKEIANDEIRAFFVSFDKNIIIAPYDGGVDFILKDTEIKDFYKLKYKEWLSETEDGY